jgi:hypothetical protein
MPIIAAKKAFFAIRQRRSKRSLAFTLDPTTGALIITPDLDLKIRKAILRQVFEIKLRLKIRKAVLRLQILNTQSVCAVYRPFKTILGYLQKLAGNEHKTSPRNHNGKMLKT